MATAEKIQRLQFSLFDNDGTERPGASAEIQWIDVSALVPHPDNPRLVIREDVVEPIVSSIKADGFQPCYALLVRPFDGAYQIISGHTRHEAAKRLSLAKLPCWIRELSDEDAFMQLVLANSQGELSPLELGMHVLKAVPTEQGKAGGGLQAYADQVGKGRSTLAEGRQAAKVFEALRRSTDEVSTERLLGKATHLYHISKAPEADWPWLVALMLADEWSVKKTQAGVAAIEPLSTEWPEWILTWLDVENQKPKAASDAAENGETRIAKDVRRWADAALECVAEMPEERPVWRVNPFDKTAEQRIWNLQEKLIARLVEIKAPSVKKIKDEQLALLQRVKQLDERYEAWVRSQQEEKEDRDRQEEARAAQLKLESFYSPSGACADIREASLQAESFNLVLTDPPYLLSNGGVTCRGNKQVKVDKNFDDAAGVAVEPSEWVPIVAKALRPGGLLVATCTRHLSLALRVAAADTGLEELEHLIWAKKSAPPLLSADRHQPKHEEIWVFKKPGEPHFFAHESLSEELGKQPPSILQFEQCSGKERLGWHDTQKPLALFSYLLKAYSKQGDLVLEPFAGSGTTVVACKQLRRRCVWLEKEPEFFAKANSRVEEEPFPSFGGEEVAVHE